MHACLYGLAHAVIVALGCAPGLGFVHVGHECSFVYDIADLYKAEVTIPIAFEVAAQAPEELPAVVRRRVRDAVWDCVCQNLKNGQATLVYTAAGEQRMEFRTHNTSWEAVDFDGIKLMRRPLPQTQTEAMDLKPGFSKAAKYQMAQKMAQRTARKPGKNDYTVIDLHAATDSIVEYGAVRVRDGQPTKEFSALVHLQTPLPAEITQLTGITQAELEGGMHAAAALETFLEFVGKDALVGYNLQFDLEFLRAACTRNQKPILTNRKIDLLPLARRKVIGVANFKLLTLVRHFGLADRVEHRALPDCRLTQRLYAKLNETGTGCN